MKKTEVMVHTSVVTMAGISLLCLSAIGAAAAGFMVASRNAPPVLTIRQAPAPTAHASLQGALNEPILGFSLEAKNKDIAVKSLTFNLLADSDKDFSSINNDLSADSLVTSCRIVRKQNGSVVAGPTPVTNGNMVEFIDQWSLTANTTSGYILQCDLGQVANQGDYILGAQLTNYPGYVVAQVTSTGNALPDSKINVGGLADTGVNIALASSVTVSGGTATSGTGDTLTFALSSTPASTTAVDGSDNVAVVGLNVATTGLTAVTVNKIVLSAYGDLDGAGAFDLGGDASSQPDINDYVESCSLYSGATLIGGPKAPDATGTTFTFTGLGWTLAAGTTSALITKCNFANTTVVGNAYFSFDIADEDADIEAEDTAGNLLSATEVIGDAPNGGTSPARVITLVDSGSLSITAGSNTPSADFILTSTNNAQVAEYRFTATNEAFNVQTLEFTEEQAEDDSGTADSSAYANNISLVTISYPKADGTTATTTSAMSGNSARFSGLSMYVPAGSPKDVKVYVNTTLTDRNAGGSASSNEKLRIAFSDGNNAGTESFKAVGADSGFTLDEAATGVGDIGDDSSATDSIATFVIRETKPVIVLSSSSPSGSAVVGRSEVLAFNVTASANEDVVLSNLIFKVNTTDNANSGWSTCNSAGTGKISAADFDFYNHTLDGTTQTLDLTDSEWSLLGPSGATLACPVATTVAFAKLTLATPEVIAKGTTNAFKLYFDSTGASSSQDDSIRFDLPTDPIVSTYLPGTTISDTSLTSIDPIISVASGTSLTVGDVACFSGTDTLCSGVEEKALITAIVGNSVTFIRGYLNSNKVTPVNGQNIVHMPSALLWQDDGSATTVMTSEEYWGAYLVDNLTINGGTLVF